MKRDIRTGKIHFFDKTLYVVSQGFTLCTGEVTGLASISLFVALGVPQAVSMLGLTVCLYTTSGIMHFMSPIHEKKLTKQIKITDFIVKYRDAVTKIIREEVDKRRKSILNCQNIYTTYPGDVPYTQTLYEQGLNLSTMDELSLKQQKQLRKIIKTRI